MTLDPTVVPWFVVLGIKEWAACLFYLVGTVWLIRNWRLRRKKK